MWLTRLQVDLVFGNVHLPRESSRVSAFQLNLGDEQVLHKIMLLLLRQG